MIRECCYCVKEIDTKPNNMASHGTCERHYKAFLVSLGISPEAIRDKVEKIYLENGSFCPDLSITQPNSANKV